LKITVSVERRLKVPTGEMGERSAPNPVILGNQSGDQVLKRASTFLSDNTSACEGRLTTAMGVATLCPAWKTWGTATTVKPNTIILHFRADETVPFADSEELVANSGLPKESLIEVGFEHRLADEESLEAMVRACKRVQ